VVKLIQILGLRDYFDKAKNKQVKTHRFFEKNWTAPSVIALMADPSKYLAEIPESERWNLYFTVANCHGERARDFHYQMAIPIDIDHINVEKKEETAQVACLAMGADYNKTAVVFSGNGLQMFILLEEAIDTPKYFETERPYYKAMCQRINEALREGGLAGDLDSSVFSGARLMRMPNTVNKKPNKPERMAHIIQGHMECQGFNLREASGIPVVALSDQIDPSFLSSFKHDTDSVLEGCAFLQHCKENPDKIAEPEWYAMLSILAPLRDGLTLAHEYSKGASSYTREDTNDKFEQAKTSSGPRTCQNINSIWANCHNCKFYGKQKSPVTIKGDDYIGTKDTGFYNIQIRKDGSISRTPNYEDLLKYFKKKHRYVCFEEDNRLFRYEDGVWVPMGSKFPMIFAEKHFNPSCKDMHRREFDNKVRVNNIVSKEVAEKSIEGKVNMKDCVYNMRTGEVTEHSPDNYFFFKTNFNYDPKALCPKFDAFVNEVLEGDEERIQTLKEFSGYGVASEGANYEKIAILIGDGANGKSVYLNIIRGLFFENAVSGYPLEALASKEGVRFEALNKPMNICEESDGRITKKVASVLKNMSGGGIVDVRELYGKSMSVHWTSVLFVAMNEPPVILDRTGGLRRRLLFINFDYFVPISKRDPYLAQKILAEEAPGIFNTLIDAYKNLKKRGHFIVPKTSSQTLEDIIDENDTLAQWLEAETEWTSCDDMNTITSYTVLHRNYLHYLKNTGVRGSYSQRKFSRELNTKVQRILDKNGEGEVVAKDVKIRDHRGKLIRGFRGLKLVENEYGI
jgi:P4 family phage/plasmid primase-like protien